MRRVICVTYSHLTAAGDVAKETVEVLLVARAWVVLVRGERGNGVENFVADRVGDIAQRADHLVKQSVLLFRQWLLVGLPGLDVDKGVLWSLSRAARRHLCKFEGSVDMLGRRDGNGGRCAIEFEAGVLRDGYLDAYVSLIYEPITNLVEQADFVGGEQEIVRRC